MCNCNENSEKLKKENIDLTVKNNKNTNISLTINYIGNETEKTKSPTNLNTISLNKAIEWANNWRRIESDYNKYNECIAFNIPKIDLQEVLAEDGVVSIRAYMGAEKITDSDGKKTYEEKLMIVGVDKNNKDMLPSEERQGATLTETDPEEGNGDGNIYDFTQPCPSFCDPNSPLNR